MHTSIVEFLDYYLVVVYLGKDFLIDLGNLGIDTM